MTFTGYALHGLKAVLQDQLECDLAHIFSTAEMHYTV